MNRQKPVISFLDAAPRENIGSLLMLFSSSYFTLDMGMSYLYSKKKVQGVTDFLVNKFYTYQDHEIDFYVPQLCYILIKYHSVTLEKFILDKCVLNIPLFLKIYWCLQAYGLAEKKNKKSYEYVELIIKKAEQAMINGMQAKAYLASPERMSRSPDGHLHLERSENVKNEFQKKKLRGDYLAETLKFINIITAVSLKLKDFKPEERKPKLKDYIKRINKWFLSVRRKHINDKDEHFRRLFYGIHIPFSSTEQDSSTMIVNILENEVTCFNTKKRAPYRIVVETVDMNEISSNNLTSKSQTRNASIATSEGRPSDLDTSFEEDTFQDLIEEQQKNKTKENHTDDKSMETKEKYGALVNFENFILEEEAKMKEGINNEEILKGADLIKKYDYMQNYGNNSQEGGPPQMTIPMISNLDDSPAISASSPRTKLMNSPLSKARRSLAQDGRIDRSASQERLGNTAGIKLMQTFQQQQLPESMNLKAQNVISNLKEEINKEHATVLEQSRTIDAYSEAEEPEVIGWGPWDELWEYKQLLIRKKSIFGHYKSYKLRSIIVKANDDLRQELIAMQIMKKIEMIWKEAGLKIRLRTYDILVTSEDSGILEMVPDTQSIDGVKKKYPGQSMLNFFKETFGSDFEEAQKNFIDSLAGYCLLCFFLQIKDRHNGNILLDAYGHIVHIDFGFLLCTSPGGINFESAPFKLTQDYIDIMGGIHSNTYTYFKLQLTKGFMELRKHVESITYLLQIMMESSDLPCFENFNVQEFTERFRERSTDQEAMDYCARLLDASTDNWRTVQYDNFQKYTNGIMP